MYLSIIENPYTRFINMYNIMYTYNHYYQQKLSEESDFLATKTTLPQQRELLQENTLKDVFFNQLSISRKQLLKKLYDEEQKKKKKKIQQPFHFFYNLSLLYIH